MAHKPFRTLKPDGKILVISMLFFWAQEFVAPTGTNFIWKKELVK
jgi:hypothetical protein